MSENQTLTDSDRPNRTITQKLDSSVKSGESSVSKHEAEIDPEIANKFYALASQWESEVEGMSPTSLFKHPAYQEIISMGTQIVPLLLQELKHNPLYWLSALNAITGANPILDCERGRVKQMAEAWLKWGKEQGYTI